MPRTLPYHRIENGGAGCLVLAAGVPLLQLGHGSPSARSPHQADFHSRFHWETLAAWCSGVAGTLLAGTTHACGFWETL